MKMIQHKKSALQWNYILLTAIFLFIIICSSCKKDTFVNPYDDESLKPPANNGNPIVYLDGFAYLHEKIFSPTCANFGCHDGNFEPDFRTIYSSYQSLVYQPVISNDASNTFTYRVTPGNSAASLLHERLTVFIPNSSGMMPLVSNSDWDANKATYIQKIKEWIDGGAKDIFGNLPTKGNIEPMLTGMLVFPSGSTSNPISGPAPYSVKAGTSVDLWFAFSDDSTAANNMSVNEIKFSTKPVNFTSITPVSMQIPGTALIGKDFQGNTVSLTHKASFNAASYTPGTVIYIRTYINDGSHVDVTENPSDGSNDVVRNSYTLQIVP